MSKKDLIELLAQNIGLTTEKSKRFLNSLVNILAFQLAQNNKVLLKNFGNFKMKTRLPRTVKAPRGEAVFQIPERKTPVFIASQNLKKLINQKIMPDVVANAPVEKVVPIKIKNLTPKINSEPAASAPLEAPNLAPTPEKQSENSKPAPKKSLFSVLFGKKPAEPIPPAETKSLPPIKVQEQIKKDAQIKNKPQSSKKQTQMPEKPAIEAKMPEAINENKPETMKENKPEVIKESKKEIMSALTSPAPSKAQIAYLDLKQKKVPKAVLTKIPEYIARLYQAIPVEQKGNKLVIAMVDPEDYQAIEFIKKKTGLEIEPVLATQEDIAHVLEQYSELSSEIAQEIKDVDLDKKKKVKREITEEEKMHGEAPTSRAVHSILKRAVLSHASDIHIEPYETEVIVRFRIDGILQKIVSLPKAIQPAVISRIKILSNMKIDENRIPQDGRFGLVVNKRKIDFRVSVFPTVMGEKAVMRILDKSAGVLTLEELGVRGHAFDILNQSITKSHGMILVTGPTGSGKSTTLYAVLEKMNKEGVNIITLEDPVEYQIRGISQGQVRSDIGFSFAKGLRSILRQDPDIIMVGEIRDLETAEMAVHAALTGHVVLSTLHTNNAAGAIPRLIDMGIEPFLITSSVNSVIAQRLTRKICENCKQKIKIAPPIIEEIKKELNALPQNEKKTWQNKPIELSAGKGCESCNHLGYKGRFGIFEIFPVSEAIKDLAIRKVSESDLETKARGEGMVSMKQDGILKALDGITTIEEVWRVTRE